MDLQQDVAAAFAPDGPLAKAVGGYRLRAQQVDMAQRVASALAHNRVLIAEAGTGTGKTFAYLVPALLSGGKVIVSTGTKTLQDQLFRRDLPAVRDALGVPVQVALLKGRANYVCHHHLARAQLDGRLNSRQEVAHLQAIARYAKITGSGDKADCPEVPEDSGAWALATSTRDNCLGQECGNYKECFVMAARRQAQQADVVVVNHHLFFADVMLRDEGAGELLPACNAVILDEAHQLPETATLFFGQSVSTGQLIELARDAKVEGLASARDCRELQAACATLDKATRDFRLTLPGEGARLAWRQVDARAGFHPALDAAQKALAALAEILSKQAERSEELANCHRRALELLARLEAWRAPPAPDVVRWVEVFNQAAALHVTPIAVGELFKRQMEGHPRAWIFTSATLAVGRDFSHYRIELGLDDADEGCWDSPFDYGDQALLYAPEGLPQPNAPGYTEAVVEAAWPVLRAAGGRAFFLCTSLRAMRRVHELLAERCEREHFDVPLLLQGEGSRSELLARFRRLGNAVLVGSQSFWEGVDVRGEALSLVVIDRLPFAPPDDPVLAARIEHLNAQGRNAFFEYQVPRAAISLKQGAGRLIRDETDRGVLMICDPRLVASHYGKRLWRALPPMRRTRSRDDAISFFAPAPVAG